LDENPAADENSPEKTASYRRCGHTTVPLKFIFDLIFDAVTQQIFGRNGSAGIGATAARWTDSEAATKFLGTIQI
jgi:hypothetical protein